MNNRISKMNAARKLLSPGPQKPVYLLNFVTNSCNAACDHCFYWEELNTKKREELSVEEHSKVAQSLGSMMQITFTGGSPELRKDLPQIVYEYYKYCKPLNMTFCMLGYSTKRIIEHTTRILEMCPDQSITIGISLDGLHEEHDKFRKLDGLFVRVLETIKQLAELRMKYNNLRVDVGMVVHGLNIETVEKSAIWVREHLPIDKLKPILVRGNPLNPDTLDDQCVSLYDNIVDRDKQWLTNRTQGKLSTTDKIIRSKEMVQREIIKGISQTNTSEITCSGGRETAVMYPTGDFAGCEMRDDIIGNARENNFDVRKIWFSANAKKFRNTVGKVDACHGCYHHCFISPAVFRTPKLWPKIVKAFAELNNE